MYRMTQPCFCTLRRIPGLRLKVFPRVSSCPFAAPIRVHSWSPFAVRTQSALPLISESHLAEPGQSFRALHPRNSKKTPGVADHPECNLKDKMASAHDACGARRRAQKDGA